MKDTCSRVSLSADTTRASQEPVPLAAFEDGGAGRPITTARCHVEIPSFVGICSCLDDHDARAGVADIARRTPRESGFRVVARIA